MFRAMENLCARCRRQREEGPRPSRGRQREGVVHRLLLDFLLLLRSRGKARLAAGELGDELTDCVSQRVEQKMV